MPANGNANSGSIYTAVYSGVPVYETMCRGIAVMRRKKDSFLNATQILKVAGVEKGKRTKILERDVLPGEHEKVQGGYGKYQGTWVPFQRGIDLAKEYEVDLLLRPLFDHDIHQGEVDNVTPTKEMVMLLKMRTPTSYNKGAPPSSSSAAATPRQSPSAKRARSTSAKPGGSAQQQHQSFGTTSMTPSHLQPSHHGSSSPSIPPSPQWRMDHPAPAAPRKRVKLSSPSLVGQQETTDFERGQQQQQQQRRSASRSDQQPISSAMTMDLDETLEGVEKYRSSLMAIFLNDESDEIPSLLTNPTIPSDLDIDLVIDDQGHTALHWAAALARIPVLELLVQKHADVRRVNYAGESALVRAVLVTNNFDRQSFPHLLNLLHRAIPIVDRKNRTLLHHITLTAGLKGGRAAASHYYLECLLEWIARNGGDFSSIVDIQDKNGDTALTIAARIGDRYLAKFLMDVGANRAIENKVGLRAEDFGFEDTPSGPSEQPFLPRVHVPPVTDTSKEVTATKRGKEVMSGMCAFVWLPLPEIVSRQGHLQDTQALLRQATRDLTETRKMVHQCRAAVQKLEEAQQKIKNLEMSLEEESQRTRSTRGYSSVLRNSSGRSSGPGGDDIDQLFGAQQPQDQLLLQQQLLKQHATLDSVRENTVEQDVIQLRSRVFAYQRNDEELSLELAETRSKTSASELLCKKVIAICCKIPLEKVDDMLVPLTAAVESDGASLDLSRVASFMTRVKKQEAIAEDNAETSLAGST
ncbi:transcriptional regulator swi6 [Dissophora globulifera]|uniref:Transcriptional regulator swi6 n=1 Tax=Dissophora globulifera TaxID=979702 RepID=A0A9P6USV5_9FUNG|nr:transcriptional regulator swi6 [Dissophora globulifera]